MKIHVVCSQMPNSNANGYAIDVFYCLRTMKEMGFEPQVHLYFPNEENDALVEELCEDDAPILFEGTETCGLMADDRLQGRRKFARVHSIRSNYYRQLTQQHKWTFRAFRYWRKSRYWKRLEANLRHAEIVCAITKADAQNLQSEFPDKTVVHMPCFFDDTRPTQDYPPEAFVLYHGNFLSKENREVVEYIFQHIVPLCPDVLFVIAGWRADFDPVPCNVKLVSDLSDEYLTQLIRTASVHLMLSMQASGIKVKLLNTVVKCDAHIIANRPMLYGHGMSRFCHQADTPQEIADAIHRLLREDVVLLREELREKTLNKMKKARISRLSLFK